MNNFEQKLSELGLKCIVLISDFYYLNNLDSDIELSEEFLGYKINADTFQKNFYKLRNSDCQKEVNWDDMLYIIDNLKLKQFQSLDSVVLKLFTPIPGVGEFGNKLFLYQTHRNTNQCWDYGISSWIFTSVSTDLNKNDLGTSTFFEASLNCKLKKTTTKKI